VTKSSRWATLGGVGKLFEQIDGPLAEWIGRQHMYFVGTAPSSGDGHLNVSPKGPIETFRILGPREVAYLDFVGSGIETIAHLRENGRIVIMFCAFAGAPRIIRLHGRGEVAQNGTARFAALAPAFGFSGPIAGADRGIRAIIRIDVTRIADSCGYGVPLMDYRGERTQLPKWQAAQVAKHGANAVMAYSAAHNARSIDALPGIEPALLPDLARERARRSAH
jgi:pyridoxamine 5'-phosphate oxidase-like protein